MTKQTAALHGRVDWKAAILGGLIGGVVFLMIEMILLVVAGESPEAPLRMMAAMVTVDGVRPPPATFDTVVVPVILSILLAVVFASVLWRWRLGSGAAVLSACWYISSTSIRWPQFCLRGLRWRGTGSRLSATSPSVPSWFWRTSHLPAANDARHILTHDRTGKEGGSLSQSLEKRRRCAQRHWRNTSIQDYIRNATELPLVGNGVIKVNDFLVSASPAGHLTVPWLCRP